MIEEDILGFDVAVGDFQFMQIFQSEDNLHEVVVRFLLVFAMWGDMYILPSMM
jgi:hypothetical protein